MDKSIPYLKEEDFKEAIVVPWLRKRGNTILRQHGHGTDEQGKDLIIKSSEGKIGACIIKPKIHGQYAQEGNIEEVRNQVNAALNVPFPDYMSKKRVKIDFAFVISENKITPTAKESIVESFKDGRVYFFSGEDIKEEYYALPLEIRKICLSIYFPPKEVDQSRIEAIFPNFRVEYEYSSDENNFGVFSRTHNFGKIKEVTLNTTLASPRDILHLDEKEIHNKLNGLSKDSHLFGVFIYFEEDKTEKIENFFEVYIKKEFDGPVFDKESKKITIYLSNTELDKFNKLREIIKPWL